MEVERGVGGRGDHYTKAFRSSSRVCFLADKGEGAFERCLAV